MTLRSRGVFIALALTAAVTAAGLAIHWTEAAPDRKAAEAAGSERVAASVKPLHSLAASLCEGGAAPAVIADGAVSPHLFSLRPSSAAALARADLIFYVGGYYDAFLKRALEGLPPAVTVAEVSQAPGVKLGRLALGAEFGHEEGHEHGEDHRYEGGAPDLHFWLSTENATAAARFMAAKLSERYPEHAGRYRANLQRLETRLSTLNEELKARMAPLKDMRYVVMHDAFRTFAAAYGLKPPASLSSPQYHGLTPGRLDDVTRYMREYHVSCVFGDAGLPSAAAKRVAEAAGVKLLTLDADGASVPAGPDLYERVMRNLADQFEACAAAAPAR